LIATSAAQFNNVFVSGRAIAGVTTLYLPGSAFLGQVFTIKDANGDASTANILVVAAALIDGAASSTLSSNYQERAYTWNGSEWSVG